MDYFVNHSCDPVVWMRDDVTVVARRAIASGEEITGDYAVWVEFAGLRRRTVSMRIDAMSRTGFGR